MYVTQEAESLSLDWYLAAAIGADVHSCAPNLALLATTTLYYLPRYNKRESRPTTRYTKYSL